VQITAPSDEIATLDTTEKTAELLPSAPDSHGEVTRVVQYLTGALEKFKPHNLIVTIEATRDLDEAAWNRLLSPEYLQVFAQ
jgi:hypothetical protein